MELRQAGLLRTCDGTLSTVTRSSAVPLQSVPLLSTVVSEVGNAVQVVHKPPAQVKSKARSAQAHSRRRCGQRGRAAEDALAIAWCVPRYLTPSLPVH